MTEAGGDLGSTVYAKDGGSAATDGFELPAYSLVSQTACAVTNREDSSATGVGNYADITALTVTNPTS